MQIRTFVNTHIDCAIKTGFRLGRTCCVSQGANKNTARSIRKITLASIALLALLSTVVPTLAQTIHHGVPWRETNAPVGNSAPAGAHLSYFGGPVISNVHVLQVLYGSGSYNAQVAGNSAPTMGNFFGDLLGTGSGYINLLTQYNTTTSGGTNQAIGNGTFDGLFQITPSAANNGSTIDDSNIQAELLAQINARYLPAPVFDAAGNVNTLYMIYFPPGKTIIQGSISSCVAGGFCAYHGTTSGTLSSKHLLYGVMPDMQAGSGCAIGCGTSSVFGNYTSVTSHELTEAITDADVGIATAFAAPLAWYDMNYGEIGDICNGQQSSYTANGSTYTIQLEFSNVTNNCVLPPPAPPPTPTLSGGVLTAFTNVANNPKLNRVHWSPDGNNLGGGQIRYEGVSPVAAMIPYAGGVLTAFANVGDNPSLNRVHWSANGNNLGGGQIRYEGVSPVTAMIPYAGGILTAFANVGGNPSLNRVHWSPDGNNLGGGQIRYEGVSPVAAMIPYAGGVLTAFANVGGNPSLNRVHWSPDGNNLGGGQIRYEGVSRVAAMIPYAGGVLTAFANVGGNPSLNRVHWSPDGNNLGGGEIRYEGSSSVTAMIPYAGGVLTAFTNAGGNPNLNRVHWSADGNNLGGGQIRYEGLSPVTAMIPY